MIGDMCSVDYLGRRLSHRTHAVEATKSSAETGNTTTSGDESVRVLVLDCRSPEEYTACHVTGALCVAVPTIVLRRLMRCGGSFPVSAANAIGVISDGDASATGGLVGGNSASGLLGLVDRCRRADLVVLYDDDEGIEHGDGGSASGGVRALTGRRSASTAVVDLLIGRLLADRCRVCRLEGGFKAFKNRFGHLCTGSSHLPERQSSTQSILNISDLSLQSPPPDAPVIMSSPRPSLVRTSTFVAETTVCPDDVIGGTASGKREHGQNNYCESQQQPFPVEVLPYLYLGDAENSRDLECLHRHNIRYVINVTPNVPNTFADHPGFRYLRIPINDHWSENVTSSLNKAFAFIDEARSNKSGVLVHCLAGISRSVTVTIAYLMTATKLSLNDAYDYLRHYRPNIAPNLSFMGQLLDLERLLVDDDDDDSTDIQSFDTCPSITHQSQSSAVIDPGVAAHCHPLLGDSLELESWKEIDLRSVKSVKEPAGRHCRTLAPTLLPLTTSLRRHGDDVTLFMTS